MNLCSLLNALAELTATETRPEARATAVALRTGAYTEFPAQPTSALAPGILHTAALPNALPVARLIRDAHQWLPWADSPAASHQPTELRAIKSVVTLLGPDAPIRSESLRFGLFFQQPGSYYPLHAHEAAETYAILAGSAEWLAGERRFQVGAGEFIHHLPNLPHAMRSGPEGFLAMWRWSGDIGLASYRMLSDPEA